MAEAERALVEPEEAPADPFVRRVRLRNYKSIGTCDVALDRLTLLVGRNGAGKSNFLDALRFVSDGLQTTLEHAIQARGGIACVRRHSTGHPRNVFIGLELNLLAPPPVAYIELEIVAQPKGGFAVKRERLEIRAGNNDLVAYYDVRGGLLNSAELASASADRLPPPSADRLYLVTASGYPEFRPVYDALRSMGFYNLNPDEMKELQSPDAGDLLHRDGSNIASVVGRLQNEHPATLERIGEYLRHIVPDITSFLRVGLGPRETLEFKQQVAGAAHPWSFHAANMSDGTLRALGILVAAMQVARGDLAASLIGIEEPETALHPAACSALMAALQEATWHTQVLVTTHSADLLDAFADDGDRSSPTILAVQSSQGETQIAPLSAANHQAMREHLFTPGELLRMDQIEPDQSVVAQQDFLFDAGDEEQP